MFGLDFTINKPQDVFIYIKGKSILPSGSFQQTTRTRNIKHIYFYCNEKSKQPKYNNLSEVKDKYLKINKMTEALNKNCVSLNENDEQIINKNLFLNVFCYNKYVKDTYKTNKLIHYENIWPENGFVIVDDEKEPNKCISKDNMKEIDEIKEE